MKNKNIEYSINVKEELSDMRGDHFLMKYFNTHRDDFDECNIVFSRTKIQKFLQDGNILINDVLVKPSYIVKQGDVLQIKIPVESGKKLDIKEEKIYFEVLYNDNDIIVINKPAGLVVHPAYGHADHTLINGLLYLFPELRKNTNLSRMGLVHRLDKDTSGVLVITKNEIAQQSLVGQFKNRTIKKEYIAVVSGEVMNHEGEINTRIGRCPLNRKRMSVLITDGKEALTKYRVIRELKNATFVKLLPYTGRTHQLRVHMNYIKHPIVGDCIYSKKSIRFHYLGLMLCAKRIQFVHPRYNSTMEFEVNLPDRFQIILEKGEI